MEFFDRKTGLVAEQGGRPTERPPNRVAVKQGFHCTYVIIVIMKTM